MESDLIVGRLYEIKCRNLIAGIWDGSKFIGIREKFGTHRIDSESVVQILKDTGASTIKYLGVCKSELSRLR